MQIPNHNGANQLLMYYFFLLIGLLIPSLVIYSINFFIEIDKNPECYRNYAFFFIENQCIYF